MNEPLKQNLPTGKKPPQATSSPPSTADAPTSLPQSSPSTSGSCPSLRGLNPSAIDAHATDFNATDLNATGSHAIDSHAMDLKPSENSSAPGKAAFYDVDGTLVSTNVVHTYAYYAGNEGSLRGILRRSLSALLSLPVFGALDLVDRKTFNEFFYRYYKGLSEDRLQVLAEDLFEDVLEKAIYPQAVDLVEEARRVGCRIVFITGALDFSVMPLVRYFGADDLIANKMQFVGGVATGKVIPPLIEGANKADAIRDYCEKHHLALNQSHAYSDSASDYAMLAAVGRPTVVNPDLRLRALANAYNWPILFLK